MFSEVYYILRARADGRYVTARPDPDSPSGYLLLFSEQFDALGYLNKHAGDLKDRFAVESITGSQIKPILQRWGFVGIGKVKDVLLPEVDFILVSPHS
ncbi:hypothetical protein [Planktothrix serta]|nr:hypothetical protein [Planktothrix serta]